jgi:hypothetical protein
MLGSLVIDNGPLPHPSTASFWPDADRWSVALESQGARDNMTSLTVIDPARLRLLPSVRPSRVVYDMMPICSSAVALVFLFII